MSLWTDMIGATVRYVDTKTWGQTRIIEAGQSNRESVIFLHGIGGHSEAYARNVVPLSERFHTIAYDYIGHGDSAKPVIDYTPHILVQHLAELMDALELESAHLCGESLGGWVSGLFAGIHPERLQRLILNTSAGLPILTDKGHQELQDLIDLSRKASTQGPPTYESIVNRMKWLFHPNNHDMISDELVNTRLKYYSRPEMRDVAPRVLAMIGMNVSQQIELDKIRAETLFLWTEDNPVHDVETARRSQAQVPGAKFYLMKADSAHWPQYEAPEEFNNVVANFLLDGTVA